MLPSGSSPPPFNPDHLVIAVDPGDVNQGVSVSLTPGIPRDVRSMQRSSRDRAYPVLVLFS